MVNNDKASDTEPIHLECLRDLRRWIVKCAYYILEIFILHWIWFYGFLGTRVTLSGFPFISFF
jgi:hypothetical protein